jgi:two-component system, cell cycle sensor histidine kinase and response regulator CckA
MRNARHEVWSAAEVSRIIGLLSGERDYLASILDALPLPVAVLSDAMAVGMANNAFWAAMGSTPDAGLGHHLVEVVGDTGAASAVRNALASEHATAELRVRSGGARTTFTVRQLAGTGELVLTGRAGTPAAPRATDPEAEQFRSAFVNHPQPQILVDVSGTITHVNREAASLNLDAGHRFADVFAPGQPPFTATEAGRFERRLHLSEGSDRTFSISTRPLGTGTILVVLEDVDEGLRRDEQQRFADRMNAVSKLAGGVSHELNNVLTVISSYCHLALDQMAQHADATADVEAILKAAGDAAQLGNHLVAIGRKHITQEGPTDLNEVLLGLERTIRGISGDAVRVSITTEARVPAVPIDPRQLERAIVAIVLHAREAMPDGGSINISTGVTGDTVTLDIEDTRNWPDEAITMSIFEPYAPWPGTRRHSGLELAVAWCILQQRGADVSVARISGRTVVRVSFRAHPRPAEPRTAASGQLPLDNRHTAEPQGPGTVLLVDDNAEIRRAIRHMLEREAYHVIDVGHPLHALHAIEELSNPIDVLVSDVNMPDMNGRELAQRARELRPGLKVLMISGYADEEIIIGQLFDEGVMFLQKPFSPDRLLKTMRHLLQPTAVKP